MIKVVSSEQMREVDRRSIEDIGIPGVVLMENAGLQVVEKIRKFFNGELPQHVLIVCGRGNNGGDGFVVARHLTNKGVDVTVILLGESGMLRGDAQTNWKICVESGVNIIELTGDQVYTQLFDYMVDSDVIVDAIFGTGLSSAAKGIYEEVINIIDESEIPVISVDIPSGLSSDTGALIGSAIQADMTVTFGLPKVGTILYPGAGYCGDLEIVDIGIPPIVEMEAEYSALLLEDLDFVGILGRRDRNAHKGTYGHLLVIGGSPGKTGAVAMAGQAALRMGTGLVTVAVPASLNPVLEMKLTEVMTQPLPETGEQTLALDSLDIILEFCHRVRAVALGPGMSANGETVKLTQNLMMQCPIPIVLDADGINALAGNIDILSQRKLPTVITPHPGEMARLMDTSVKEIQQNRIEVARDFAVQHGVIVALKGARTVIAEPSGRVYVNPTGNPGMASGGTGDVLTGIIAGALTQGLDPVDATNLGIYLHGLAADIAAEELGEVALTAMDIHDFMPEAIMELNLETI
jgi:NAD(P)H-hydrate epimerase